ncbi:MAG: hypothetical protein AABX38_01185 [Candidatus Micrarchaeota archaeon]
MRFSYLLISFLMILSVSFSVSFPDYAKYLYKSENVNLTSIENFTINSSNYSLVKYSGAPILLYKDDLLLNDVTQITFAIQTYYKNTFYVKQSELDTIRDLLLNYNQSRNDGGKFKSPPSEEYACRNALLLNGFNYGGTKIYCDSTENCSKIAVIFYTAPYTEGVRRQYDLATTTNLLRAFATASYGNDQILTKNFLLLDNLSESNINNSLSQISSSVTLLGQYKNTIEGTVFRTPVGDSRGADWQKCIVQNCFGICPDLSFNGSALNTLNANITSLISRIGPYINYQSVAQKTYSSTTSRLNYTETEKMSLYYTNVYLPLFDDATQTASDADSVLSLILSTSLQNKVGRLKELSLSINKSISGRNFTSIEADLDEYSTLISNIKSTLPKVQTYYNATITAKKETDVEIFKLYSQELSADSKTRFDKVRSYVSSLDNLFKSGSASETQLSTLAESYKNATKAASAINQAEQSKPISILSKFRTFSRNVNSALASSLPYFKLNNSSVLNNRPIVFGSLSTAVFVSLFAGVVFLSVVYYTIRGLPKSLLKKAIFGIIIGVLLFGALLISAIFHIYLEKTVNLAQLNEFLIDLKDQKEVFVFVDTINSPSNDTSSDMVKCGLSLADNLRNKSISSTVYQYDGAVCSLITKDSRIEIAVNQCVANTKSNAAFVMRYSGNQPSSVFTAIFDVKSYLAGDQLYYKSCAISDLVAQQK